MTKIILYPKDLEAAHLAASTEEVRYYLHGVYIEPYQYKDYPSLTVRMTGTDGHQCVSIVGEQYVHHTVKAFTPFIMHTRTVLELRKAVKAAKQWRPRTPILIQIDTETYSAVVGYGINELDEHEHSQFNFEPVDGTFPEIDRFMPKLTEGHSDSGVVALNPKYIANIAKAVCMHHGNKCYKMQITLNEPGSPVLITNPCNAHFTAVIMPVRA